MARSDLYCFLKATAATIKAHMDVTTATLVHRVADSVVNETLHAACAPLRPARCRRFAAKP